MTETPTRVDSWLMQLTMVKSPEVATRMVQLADEIDPTLRKLNTMEPRAFHLAGALQRCFCSDLGMGKVPVSTKAQGD